MDPETNAMTETVVLTIVYAVLFVGVATCVGVTVAVLLGRALTRALFTLRALRTCEDCGATNCPVEIFHDLDLQHRGTYTK